MSSPSRTRVLNQLSWAIEEADSRSQRRDVLQELDGLLTDLEESNLRGYEISAHVLAVLRGHAVTPPRGTTAPELIEAIFAVQERYMRQPERPVAPQTAELLGGAQQTQQRQDRIAS